MAHVKDHGSQRIVLDAVVGYGNLGVAIDAPDGQCELRLNFLVKPLVLNDKEVIEDLVAQ